MSRDHLLLVRFVGHGAAANNGGKRTLPGPITSFDMHVVEETGKRRNVIRVAQTELE
jgi:hypothetical protein